MNVYTDHSCNFGADFYPGNKASTSDKMCAKQKLRKLCRKVDEYREY